MAEGLTLAGRYRLISKLGQGGMGSVWRAEHLTLGIPVAVKLIDASIAQSEEALARFRREAQAAAELRSAHVVHIIDYGVEDSTPYIAMELLEGESLSARLERVGRLTPADTVSILSQVTRALTRAHQQHIIHRDLKPENIFIVQEGDDEVVKVLDFGIAKKLGLDSTSSGVKTHTGAMLGTPYYMSPEQAKGHPNVDHRTDIWSLGIITYECLTGVRPFERETLASLLIAICTEPLPIPSQIAAVPRGFDAWFARVASRDVSARFQSVSEAITQLREVCGISANAPSLEITGSPGATADHGSDLSALGQTGDPSAITITGAKTKRLRGAALLVAAAILITVTAVLARRAFSRREDHITSASTSPSLAQSVDTSASISRSAHANGRLAPPATESQPKATASSAPLEETAKIETAASAEAVNTQKSGAPVHAKHAAGKVSQQPARRDYDKSVGF